MLNLQYVFGGPSDVFRDLMLVGRSKQKCAQDQHVQGSLQQVDPIRGIFRHGVDRHSTQIFSNQIDHRPEIKRAKCADTPKPGSLATFAPPTLPPLAAFAVVLVCMGTPIIFLGNQSAPRPGHDCESRLQDVA
jgi:hypothetical protein